MSLPYRVSQLWWNLTAEPLPEAAGQEIAALLTPVQTELFYRFQEPDQWHSYRVYSSLIEADHFQPDLLAAALLHDIGKTQVNLSPWDRILIVIMDRLMPDKLNSWGQGDLHSWQRPFVVRQLHARWGADMAAAAGCSDLTVALIRRHQDPVPGTSYQPADQLLRYLQWADDLN